MLLSRSSTWIKICGITRVADAKVCIANKVDAIGLVFVDASPRNIELDQAIIIADAVNNQIKIVALFMNPEVSLVQRVIEKIKPDMLQFHGSETDLFCRQFQMPYIKALSINDDDLSQQLSQHDQAIGFIIDSHQPGEIGGTGKTFDWQDITLSDSRPLIIAGGLKPDNVALAIEQCKAYGVDTSSGLEVCPGIKDHEKIKSFVMEVACAARNRISL